MKKTLLVIILIFLVILSFLVGQISRNNRLANEVRRHNQQYEEYLGREVMGTELASLINRAMNENRRNNIEEDEYGRFIENGTNSIRIDVEMITIERTFTMESLYNQGMSEFVQFFNFITFESVDVRYHERTGKIRKIVFQQLEE